jgi:hypothetical protein
MARKIALRAERGFIERSKHFQMKIYSFFVDSFPVGCLKIFTDLQIKS